MGLFSGEHLTCVRGERLIFRHLAFDLEPGGALVLTGPNGSGKSSLLRLMAGLGRPFAGRLLWQGADTTADRLAHGSRLHYVGHHDALKMALTVRENLRFWARIWGAGRDDDPDAALDAVGLKRLADFPARYLSAGQRRRLALARLVAAAAPLWLLDEPRTALDTDAIARLDALIANHRAAGGLVVVALHGGGHPPAAETLDMRDFMPGEPTHHAAPIGAEC